MKLYSVVYTIGCYDDQEWTLMGVFSSREKAEEFINLKCSEVDPESKREEWLIDNQRVKARYEDIISDIRKDLQAKTEADEKAYKRGSLMYHQAEIIGLQSSINYYENILKNFEASLTDEGLNAWAKDRFRPLCSSGFEIIEGDIDQEIL